MSIWFLSVRKELLMFSGFNRCRRGCYSKTDKNILFLLYFSLYVIWRGFLGKKKKMKEAKWCLSLSPCNKLV